MKTGNVLLVAGLVLAASAAAAQPGSGIIRAPGKWVFHAAIFD